MDTGNQQMQVHFHDMATAAFFSRYDAFAKASSLINRKLNEYQFQELKQQYVHSLEQDLKLGAGAILQKAAASGQLQEMNSLFHRLMMDYLHRFVQKINNL
jgi:hypothetical protein